MILVEVAVAAPVSQTYTYALAGELEGGYRGREKQLIGRRVYVPFGPRRVTGYIFSARNSEENPEKLKHVDELLDDEPLFHQDLTALFEWVAGYYHYPLGEVVKTALPAGLTVKEKKRLRLTEKKGLMVLAEAGLRIEDYPWLGELVDKRRLGFGETARLLAGKKDSRLIHQLAEQGWLAIDTCRAGGAVREKREPCYRPGPGWRNGRDQDDLRTLPGGLSKGETKTLRLVAEGLEELGGRFVPRRELLARYPYAARLIPGLVDKQLLEPYQRRVYRTPLGDVLPRLEPPSNLTGEQEAALEHIYPVIDNRHYQTFLLHGITGSGKTEVYLRAAERVRTQGRGVLVLVPEIALATQLEAHFISRFGEQVAILHSGLSAGEKFDQWTRIYSGQASVVIGARSAVFAPLADLGLVIVDEEHDSSFKQEEGLRYHSRDVAIMRANLNGAAAILGSATPAVTSYQHAAHGKYTLIEMNRRVGGRVLPEVEVIDLKRVAGEQQGSLFSDGFAEALAHTYRQGDQAILLLNRRGFSASVICRDCGTLVECRHCKVTLNLHKQRARLVCHYCGFSVPEKVQCGVCGSGNLAPVGIGSERIEQEAKALLPEARIARLDSDMAVDRTAFLKILQEVRDGRIDVLVGTQMIAKGLHFPGVTLVGIVWADCGLAFPDYRAAEKTYQLIAQVTGRAGRGEKPGRVMIQTMQPDHYAISLAASHNYGKLAEKELNIRRSAGFPPFVRLVSVKLEGPDQRRIRQSAVETAEKLRQWCQERRAAAMVTVLGPAPAPIEKIKDLYRWQILLKSANLRLLHELVGQLGNGLKIHRRDRLVVDIDPENML